MDIQKLDRTALKSFFVKNAVPTESNFADLIDGMINQKEDGIAKLAGEPLSIQADGTDTSQKKAINFYKNFADRKPAWTLSLNPRVDPNNAGSAKPGFSIGDGDGNSKLFIDQTTGNLGIGTVEPAEYKLKVNGLALVSGNYLYVSAENAGRLRVGAAWGMPGLYSSDDGAKPLMLGVAAGQKIFLGVATTDAFVEGGSGNAFFKGKVGVGVQAPGETLDVSGRVKSGPATIGPWPANAIYAHFGANTLNQADAGNYALLQGTTDGPGRTFLNSPVDIRFRIGNADQMMLANNGNVGIGTTGPTGKLHVQTGGTGGWDRFVVKTTNLWGDGNAQYVTIGEGGAAGIMFYNPHVVWQPEGRASIRMGRSGGVATGHWWDIGVRAGNMFSIVDGQNGAFGLSIDERGTVLINVLQLGGKWRMSGVGDHDGNDEWLRLKNIQNNNYFGGFAAGKFWSGTGNFSGSDARLKSEVSPLREAEVDVLRLRGVRFKWRDAPDSAPHGVGLIAQEVEEVFPEVVATGPDGMKGINYSALIAPLIEAVKEQHAQIDELRSALEALRAGEGPGRFTPAR